MKDTNMIAQGDIEVIEATGSENSVSGDVIFPNPKTITEKV
jgi:hypothetical protein